MARAGRRRCAPPRARLATRVDWFRAARFRAQVRVEILKEHASRPGHYAVSRKVGRYPDIFEHRYDYVNADSLERPEIRMTSEYAWKLARAASLVAFVGDPLAMCVYYYRGYQREQ